jgi:electron transfer flavoprotein alpha subunit
MSVVLGLVEQEAGSPAETSLEMLTMARSLADETDSSLAAVTFGDEGAAVGEQLGAHGVEALHHVTHDRLDRYAPEAWGESICQLLSAVETEALVTPGTDRGHEVLAHVGAELDLPMVANCLEIEPGDEYEITRERWGGSLLEHARLDAETTLLTASKHEHPIEEVAEAADPSVLEFTPSLDERHFRVRVDRVEDSDAEGVPLGEARVVVGGGRGVGGPEDYDKLEALADRLGGAVGASRAAVNEGWRPHDDQIGLTGTKISPDIYVACGISGAVQHMVGCKGADNILAINTDPEAAIIGKAEWAVVGDLHEVVPAINDAIENHENGTG